MRLDRLVGGICLGLGITRLILRMDPPLYNWILLIIGLFGIGLYCAERFIAPYRKWLEGKKSE